MTSQAADPHLNLAVSSGDVARQAKVLRSSPAVGASLAGPEALLHHPLPADFFIVPLRVLRDGPPPKRNGFGILDEFVHLPPPGKPLEDHACCLPPQSTAP